MAVACSTAHKAKRGRAVCSPPAYRESFEGLVVTVALLAYTRLGSIGMVIGSTYEKRSQADKSIFPRPAVVLRSNVPGKLE